MSGFVANLQTVFNQHQALFSVAGLGQFHLLDRAQDGHRGVLRIDHEGVTGAHEAVRHDVDSAEVRNIHVGSANDLSLLASRNVAEAGRDAGEGRSGLLVERANHEHLGRTARSPHLSDHVLEERFSERTLRTVGTGRNASVVRAVRSLVDVGLHPRRQAGGAASGGGVTSNRRLVGEQGALHVTLQFRTQLGELIGQFRTTAGLVQSFQSAGDHDVLGADLGVVTDASGRVHSGERRNVVTFQSGVRSRSSGEAIGLPFEVGVLDILAADVRDERGLFRRDVIDHIRQVFTNTNRRIAGEGVCYNCHDSNSLNEFVQ